MSLSIKFWGVRGSVACPNPKYVQYGGNTSCVEVRAADQTFIFDAGTGIKELSKPFLKSNRSKAYVFLTHTHWDHINGYPFFEPFYKPNFSFDVYAGHLKQQGSSIKTTLAGQMSAPMFPVPLQTMRANITYHDFDAGQTIWLNDQMSMMTLPLNHPNGSTGYRLNYNKKSMCYITDHEHGSARNEPLIQFVQGADILIYDCTYTDEEYPQYIGWGHSTWQEGVKLAEEALVKKLIIFHHDPNHDDGFMDIISKASQQRLKNSIVAKEGMEIEV